MKSRNPAILCVIHRRQNPLNSTAKVKQHCCCSVESVIGGKLVRLEVISSYDPYLIATISAWEIMLSEIRRLVEIWLLDLTFLCVIPLRNTSRSIRVSCIVICVIYQSYTAVLVKLRAPPVTPLDNLVRHSLHFIKVVGISYESSPATCLFHCEVISTVGLHH
jgi:hypothetical protein